MAEGEGEERGREEREGGERGREWREGEEFVCGVNYWPRRKAMYWWKSFEEAEVREEFAIIRSLGMRYVRIFLLWEDFQPTPHTVNSQSIAHLVAVAEVCV